MKNILIFLSVMTPSLLWGQMTKLDSVNYYFGILLNKERDSINQYNAKHNPEYKVLNRVVVETDDSKFVNPWKHIDYCIEESHNYKSFEPHTTTNKENSHFFWFPADISSQYTDPKKIAHDFFWGWKKSKGHYKFMIQDTDGNLKYFLSDDYTTFKVLYKISYRNYPLENVKQKKNIPFVMVATFTAWE